MIMALLANAIILVSALINGLLTGFSALNIMYIALAGVLLVINLDPVVKAVKLDKGVMKPVFRLAAYAGVILLAFAVFHMMPQSQALKDANKASAAYAMIQSGKTDDAIRELERLKESMKDNSIYHQNFAAAYMNKGLLDMARKELDAAYSLNPSNYSIYYNYGLWCYKSKDYEGARQNFAIAAELNPGMVSAYKYTGKMYRLQNNIRAAIYQYSLARRFAPGDLELSYLLGKAYYDLDEFENARTELEKVRQANAQPNIKSDIENMLSNLDKVGEEAEAK